MHHPAFRETHPNRQAKPGRASPHALNGRSTLDYMQLQLTELLTRYGPVALVWFDGLGHQEKYDGSRFLRLIHNLQAGTLVNNRIGLDADYETPEQFIPKAIPTKGVSISGIDSRVQEKLKQGIPSPDEFRLWETCMTIRQHVGFRQERPQLQIGAISHSQPCRSRKPGWKFPLKRWTWTRWRHPTRVQQRLREIGRWAGGQWRRNL